MNKNPRGMLLLDKPVGVTSFQALGACKRLFGTKKIGHAGTLDKFASGLLLVFVGDATRLVPWFVGLDKNYQATIRFGEETATLDPEGEVVRQAPVPEWDLVKAKMPAFRGPQLQVPPSYSAIHVDGKRAYERVLSGEVLELKPRPVIISCLECLDWHSPDLQVQMDCSSGTYVRSLARDLGDACHSAAHLVALRRHRVGTFMVENALPGVSNRDEILPQPGESAWLEERKLGELIPGCRILELQDKYLADFCNGKLIRESWFCQAPELCSNPVSPDDWVVVCGDAFPGIIRRESSAWTYRLVFPARADS